MRLECLAFALVLLSGCGSGHDGAATEGSTEFDRIAPAWDEEFYNYAAEEDDLVIDGPCGSKFVFRAVETRTADSWLASERVLMGQAQGGAGTASSGVLEGVREASVVGGFVNGDDPTSRFYYIGKYEVTIDQFDAVMSETCPEPSLQEGTMPMTGLSRFDAIAFTVALNEWIYRNPDARATLPMADQTPGVVRLPTEVEWEFAARGGQAVTEEERIAALYPMDDLESRYEWYQGDDSCRGSLQPVGYLLPNPLGLHDMLGNAREIVQDSFQLTAGRRLQGQVGAMLTKGGACDTPLEALRTAARQEYLDFNHEAGSVNRPPLVGFRLALGAPAVPSNRRQSLYEEAYERLRLPRAARTADGADPAAELRALAEQLSDNEAVDAIERIAGSIDAEMIDRNTFEMDNAKALITSSASLLRNYRFANADAISAQNALARDIPDTLRAQFESRAVQAGGVRDLSRDFYAQSILRMAEFEPRMVMDAARIVSNDYAGRFPVTGNNLTISQMVCLFASQALDYQTRRPGDLQPYFDEIEQVERSSAPACPALD